MQQLILFNVFNGLIVGAFYALMALGLSLILNLSGVINFAHGGFLAIGAYTSALLAKYFAVDLSLSIVAGAVMAGLSCVALPRLMRAAGSDDAVDMIQLITEACFYLCALAAWSYI